MEVKCAVCGQVHEVAKWEGDYERLRELGQETYICDACQARIRHDAQRERFPRSSG